MTGGVVVGYAGDLITLIIGLETLTLPLYLLVGLRRPVVGGPVAVRSTAAAGAEAAVPLHAWAPVTYDGAPLPIAAYLSTASKLGGVVALIAVTHDVLPAQRTG